MKQIWEVNQNPLHKLQCWSSHILFPIMPILHYHVLFTLYTVIILITFCGHKHINECLTSITDFAFGNCECKCPCMINHM
jgi:hypothetical protein